MHQIDRDTYYRLISRHPVQVVSRRSCAMHDVQQGAKMGRCMSIIPCLHHPHHPQSPSLKHIDDENASCSHDEENAQLSLLDVPVEIFLRICSFLDTPTLVHSLSLVCKQFYLILKDDSMWKARINYIWPGASHSLLYPVRPDKLFWKSSCIAIEKQAALWKQQEKLIKVVHHYIHIRALLLIHDGTTCIAGGRNGALVYWKLPSREKLPSDEIGYTVYTDSAYITSICDLTAIYNTVYSCSSDSDQNVKSWVLTNTGPVHYTTYKIGMPNELWCISSCPERALFATGSITGIIYVFDSRASNKPIMQYYSHIGAVTKPVRKLAMNTDYIVSASVGNTVAVWDQRAGRIMKSITISGLIPTCMSMQRDWVIVGDSDAKCHMLNPKNNFELVKSYSTEHTEWITGVHLTHGCLITSSTDGTVRISSPTDPPKSFATLHSDFRVTADNMDYLNDTLAISGGGTITIWRPKSKKYQ